MRGSPFTLAFFLVALGPGVSAWAQGSSSVPAKFDVQLFHPAVGPKSFVTLDSADVPGHLQFNVGLLTNYQYGAFTVDSTVAGQNLAQRLDLVRHQAMAELCGAVGLFNLFEVGVAVPMTLYLSGDDFDSAGRGTGAQVHTYGRFGDLRVEAKAAPLAFGPDQAFVFGLSAGVTFPADYSENFLGEKTVTGRGRALLEYQSSERFRALVMLGVLLREKSQVLGAVIGDQMLYGAAVDFRVLPDMSVLAEINGRVGSWTYVDANPLELDLAMRAHLPAMFSLLLGVGLGLDHGIGSPMLRGFMGLGWAPDFRDRDHDGIIDALDRCPDEPEDKDGFQDDDGCPDPDNDNDGVPDIYDACPNDPEDMDGFEDNDGCPDLDNDKDGIPDKKDKCPNEPETLNGNRDDDGCPDPGAPIVVLREDKIDIIERITFLPGQTDLSPQGLTIVKLVAMVMRGHTELGRVRIDIRADGVTEATMRGRAQEVALILAAHGVDTKRLKVGNVSSGSSRVQFIIENRVAPKSVKAPFPATSLPPPPEAPPPQAHPPEAPAPQAHPPETSSP